MNNKTFDKLNLLPDVIIEYIKEYLKTEFDLFREIKKYNIMKHIENVFYNKNIVYFGEWKSGDDLRFLIDNMHIVFKYNGIKMRRQIQYNNIIEMLKKLK